MGLLGRWRIRELKARAKRRLGASTGNRTLAAEARTEEAEARLLQTRERLEEVARQIRREYGVRH
ncbi:hypothetical protein Sme01_40120 [Sphaerisporangium melleum]|uniref:CsbD family protein n=1 Tax=Sphaerisporangium melleum TaxID=321316 RepID=A0A917R2V6_9ACTN|nr:hypothetical protein [Sphaerisporangium melleum]GGK86650.1 hypothetical protein GCM10007964_31540 [Sphaerisporangium melleum]GII71536.1 hypothetical protein Sme01_40120 [Sphaerisporangium melleum]